MNCSDCKFYSVADQECRRNAPTFTMSLSGGWMWFSSDAVSGWPNVGPDDWCGEWEAKP